MLPKPSRAPKLAFGPFEFDRASVELFKHGYKVKLPLQPGQVLAALLDRPGDLVSRQDLRNRLWPGATAGDFEHGLNAAVNKLRQALGDSADQPRYVETLSGLGYRFVAPVYPVGGTVPLAALLALLASASWMAFRRSSDSPPLKPTQFLVTPPKGYFLEGGWHPPVLSAIARRHAAGLHGQRCEWRVPPLPA